MARTKASNEAQYKYNSTHLKRIPLDVQLSEYDLIKAFAEASGESVNGYIKAAIRQRMEREGCQATDPASVPAAPQGERGEAGVGGVTSPNTEN